MIACKRHALGTGVGTSPKTACVYKRPLASSAVVVRGARAHVRCGPCAAVKKAFKSFDDMLMNTSGFILVDFYATWCGPCLLMAQVLETVAPQIKSHMTVVKIDTEKYENLAARYQIQELPTMIVFKQGEVVQRIKGYRDPEELMQVLSPYITARA